MFRFKYPVFYFFNWLLLMKLSHVSFQIWYGRESFVANWATGFPSVFIDVVVVRVFVSKCFLTKLTGIIYLRLVPTLIQAWKKISKWCYVPGVPGWIRFVWAFRFETVEKCLLQISQNVKPLWLFMWFCRDLLLEKLFSQWRHGRCFGCFGRFHPKKIEK